jgi:hypothetical protein
MRVTLSIYHARAGSQTTVRVSHVAVTYRPTSPFANAFFTLVEELGVLQPRASGVH